MALFRCGTTSGGGGSGEKPTLLWSNASGKYSDITVDHSTYDYLIFICSYSTWEKKSTLCGKTVSVHTLSTGGANNATASFFSVDVSVSNKVTFPKKESNKDKCYAIYGCNSLNIDYTDIYSSWNCV